MQHIVYRPTVVKLFSFLFASLFLFVHCVFVFCIIATIIGEIKIY